MNPLTILSFAASAWILILGVNNPWLSAFFLGCGVAVASRAGAHRAARACRWRCSLAVMPHSIWARASRRSNWPCAAPPWLPSRLAAFSTFTIADLAKAMQATRAPANPSFTSLVPLCVSSREGRATFEKVRYAQHLAYRRPVNPLLSTARALLPTITHLLDAGAQRAPDLERFGCGGPAGASYCAASCCRMARRTKLLRIIVPAAAIVVVIALWM